MCFLLTNTAIFLSISCCCSFSVGLQGVDPEARRSVPIGRQSGEDRPETRRRGEQQRTRDHRDGTPRGSGPSNLYPFLKIIYL